MLRYQIDIFEDTDREPARYPVLSHIFYGADRDGVTSIISAHRKTDSFLNAALTTKTFKGMRLRTQERWLANI